MFLCIYYLYFPWFSGKPLFVIARYSLLASEKKYAAIYHSPLFKTMYAYHFMHISLDLN